MNGPSTSRLTVTSFINNTSLVWFPYPIFLHVPNWLISLLSLSSGLYIIIFLASWVFRHPLPTCGGWGVLEFLCEEIISLRVASEKSKIKRGEIIWNWKIFIWTNISFGSQRFWFKILLLRPNVYMHGIPYLLFCFSSNYPLELLVG